MDYSTWIANLQGRGYKTTNVAGETNFSGYANALSNDIKAKVAANAQSAQDKDLQAFVASLFNGASNMSASKLVSLAQSKGLKVSTKYVKTSYIVDEKASGTKGKGKVTNGSIAIYEITDAKGGKLTIADANGNAAIEIEEVFLNEILSGVTSDIANGASGTSEADARLEALKAQDVQLKKEVDNLQKQYEKEVKETQEAIKEEEDKIQKETQEIAQRWESKIEADPSRIYDMNAELQSVLNSGNAKIAALQSKINNNATMAKLQGVINNALKVDAELTQSNTNQTATTMDGYKAQQLPSVSAAEKYNQMMVLNAKAAAGLSMDVANTAQANVQNVNATASELKTESKIAYNKAEEEAKKEKAEQEAKEQKKVA